MKTTTPKKRTPKTFSKRGRGCTIGFYWHIHHRVLAEATVDIGERVSYIKTHKPGCEIATRLRLMRPIKVKGAPKWMFSLWRRFVADNVYGLSVEVEFEEHHKALEKLHAEQCKRCPWDGESIF